MVEELTQTKSPIKKTAGKNDESPAVPPLVKSDWIRLRCANHLFDDRRAIDEL